MDLMLPIMHKIIKGKHLVLQDYAVQPGQINGLTQAILQTGKPDLKSIFIDGCSMTDSMTAWLLETMAHTKLLQEFVYKRNVFLESSLMALNCIL